MPDPTRVLFIGGAGRSGSTLMERFLSERLNCFSAGELRWIWGRGLRDNQSCSCGLAFRSCPFWTEVFASAFGGFDTCDLRDIETLRVSVDRLRYIPALRVPAAQTRAVRSRILEFGLIVARLYRAIGDVSGAEFVLDSSKDPSYAYVLRTNPGIDLNVIHLVRDSRAVAYSWQRKRLRPEIRDAEVFMARFTPWNSAQVWLTANFLMARLRTSTPSILIRYEDFVSNPASVVEAVSTLAPECARTDVHPSTAWSRHTVSGNPIRFDREPIAFRPDNEWRTGIDPRTAAIVTMMTRPMLKHYGYSIDPLSGREA